MKLTSDNKSCEDAFEAGKKVLWIKRGYLGVVIMMIPPEKISGCFHDREIRFTEDLLGKFCHGPRATSRRPAR
jgi:hypothetical protein